MTSFNKTTNQALLSAAHSLKMHDTGYESPFPGNALCRKQKLQSPGVKVLSGYYCVTKWKKRLIGDDDL